MNFSQMKVAVKDILTSGGGQNTSINTDLFWTDGEIRLALNNAQKKVYNIIRRARRDYFTRIVRSTDAALIIGGQTFTPSTLAWTVGGKNYTLPPDFVRMKLITDLSTDKIVMRWGDIATNAFRVLMNVDASNTAREYLWDILGIRTLIVRPIPQETRDFEFIYEKLLDTMREWQTGTLTLTNASAIATFSAGADIQNRLVVGDELIIGTSAVAQSTPDPNAVYPVIKSIDSATQVTLAGPYLDSSVISYAFTVSSVTEIPAQHHEILLWLASQALFKKGTNPHTDAASECQDRINDLLPDLVADVELRQGSDQEYVQAYLEDNYAE